MKASPRHLVGPLVLFLLASCGQEVAPPPPPPPPPAEVPPPDVKFDLADMTQNAETIALVPSPAEMQKALSAAGIDTRLAKLVAERPVKTEAANKQQVAVRTGVVLARLLLTVKDGDKAALVSQLRDTKGGLEKLGAGPNVLSTVDDMANRLENDAVSRDDLVKEMDELAGVMVPELENTIGKGTVPLIQAGSWVEGANLVASALKAEGKFDKAAVLLKQPAVVDYFLGYVRSEGKGQVDDKVLTELEKSLVTLQEVCKKDTFGQAEIDTVQQATNSVLALL